MRIPLTALLTLVVGALAVERPRAQTGSYSFFGEGCSWKGLPFVVSDVPRIGRQFVVESGVSCNGMCTDGSVDYFVLTGASNTAFRGVPLPFDSRLLGLRVCGLWRVSIELCASTQGKNIRGYGEVVLPIPNDPCLIGASFYQQVLLRSCEPENGCTYILSRGGHGVIGC